MSSIPGTPDWDQNLGKEVGHGAGGNNVNGVARFWLNYRPSIFSLERQQRKVKTKSLQKFLKRLEASLKTRSQ